MFGFLQSLIGNNSAKEVKKMRKIVDHINELEPNYVKLSDANLVSKTDEFKRRLQKGETLDDILPEAFAVCREASKRVLGMRHFDVQLLGGICLHRGNIAEMRTGEGKTLVATLAVYLNALTGKGVHVVTVNDYLATRDSEQMGRLYNFLGLSTGLIVANLDYNQRKQAYGADVTYGTNNEFGFDYLRDNMVSDVAQMVQRPLNYAIVDEVDSILIDEARTPLIISGPGNRSTDNYYKLAKIVPHLVKDEDYTVDEKQKTIAPTDSGIEKVEKMLGVENLYDAENIELNHLLGASLRAHAMMHRDTDYVVKDGEVVIVDEFTGRLMFGRRYSDGLHQAIEAKEGLKVERESQTLASITFQNYFRMYEKLSGMTGTAKTEEKEFNDIYGLDVIPIPPNRPLIRVDLPDLIFKTKAAKYRAVVRNAVERHQTGQPILIGTTSITQSEELSDMLLRAGVPHKVLNAKHHEQEAEIVADAGQMGMVTIATNMAGRGTDIILGGNPDFEARREMKKLEYTPEQIAFATGFEKSDDEELNAAREKYQELLKQFAAERKDEQEEVRALGGLCIIGTERHESRRIDNQLRGRSGRQGDPGYSRFYLSLEDELMVRFGADRLQRLMGKTDDTPLESKMVSRSVESAQKRVEGNNYDARKQVLQYDDVLRKQREIMYAERNEVLENEVVTDIIDRMTEEAVEKTIEYATQTLEAHSEKEETEEIVKSLNEKFLGQCPIKEDEYSEVMSDEEIKQLALEKINNEYEQKRELLGDETMNSFERYILLNVIDDRWTDHIDQMDQLRKGIFLRSYGQIDPLREYKNEGHEMFEYMIDEIECEVVANLLRIRVERHEEIELKEEKTNLVTNDSKEHIARGPVRSASREEKKARIKERKQRVKELKAQKQKEKK